MQKETRQVSELIEKNKEKRGRNVTVHAIFVRHGEKTTSTGSAETGLTEKGKTQARTFGQNLEKGFSTKPYSSNTDRTKNTIKEAIQASATQKQFKFRVKDELGFVYDTKGTFVQNIFLKKKEILGKNPTALLDEELHKKLNAYETYVANYFLGFGDKRPDPKTESPVELASKIARRVNLYIKMADRLNSGSNISLLNGTHDMCIHAFLKEILIRRIDSKPVRGFEKIEEIGGPVDFTEFFEIQITTDAQANKHAKLTFRGQKFDIDEPRLQKLAQMAKK